MIAAHAKVDLKSPTLPEVEKKLGSPADGPGQAEANKRLAECGPNEIEEKKTNPFLQIRSLNSRPLGEPRMT